MNIKAISLILAICLAAEMSPAGTSGIQPAEQYLLVEYSDHAGKASLKVLGTSEHKTLLNEIRTEARLWGKAMSAAQKTWEAGRNTEPFPKSAIHQKSVTVIETFTNEASATATLDLREKIANAGKEDAKKKSKHSSPGSSSSCAGSSSFSISQYFKKVQARRLEMEARKASLQEIAIRLFADKLVETASLLEVSRNQPASTNSPAGAM